MSTSMIYPQSYAEIEVELGEIMEMHISLILIGDGLMI